MNKKFLSLVLALVMVLGTLTPVFAEEAAPKDKIEKAAKTAPSTKVQWLVDEKIVSGRKLFKDGDEKSDLALDKNLQRAEITRLLVLGKGLENLANLVQGTMRPYLDVDNSHWANGVITVGSYHLKNTQNVPMLAGYPGNKFLPDRNVSYAELVKMLVVLVDNSITPKMVEKFDWPSDWMVRAANLGILAGIEVKDSNAFVTRQVAFEMVYNALYLHDTRHTVDYGTKFGVVSGYVDGELKLNQGDKAFSVKLSNNTLYVDGSGYATFMPLTGGYNGLVLGSLVRVIADKDGNATHIVELGNPVKGAIKDGNRWYGVADKVVAGIAKNVTKDGIEVFDDTFDTKLEDTTTAVAGKTTVKINFTSNTKFFVADTKNGQLTEVKNAEARDMLYLNNKVDKLTPKVYVGYDVNTTRTNINGATVVVFNMVDYEANKTYVRVLNPSNGAYSFFAEKADGVGASYDLSRYGAYMPGYLRSQENSSKTAGYYGQFEKLNVLSLNLVGDTNKVMVANVEIDYAHDPIFKVVDRTRDHAGIWYLTLEGKDGERLVDVRVKNTTFFNERQFASIKDNYVQVPEKSLVKTADGYYFKDFDFAEIASILEAGQVNRALAKVDPRYGQNKLRVQVTIPEEAKDFGNGIWRVKVTKVVYDTPNDKNAQEIVDGSFRYYYVVASDATKINESIQNHGAPAMFNAEVVVNNRPGQQVDLNLGSDLRVENNLVGKLDDVDKVKVANPAALLSNEELNKVHEALAKKNADRNFKVENGVAGKLILKEAGKWDQTINTADVAK